MSSDPRTTRVMRPITESFTGAYKPGENRQSKAAPVINGSSPRYAR